MLLIGFITALLLVWTSIWLRTRIAGFVGGFCGVCLAVAFGFGVFHLLVGPGAFGIFALLATTLPLLIHVHADYLQARKLAAIREQFYELARTEGREVNDAMADELSASPIGNLAGEIVGLVSVYVFFVSRATITGS